MNRNEPGQYAVFVETLSPPIKVRNIITDLIDFSIIRTEDCLGQPLRVSAFRHFEEDVQ